VLKLGLVIAGEDVWQRWVMFAEALRRCWYNRRTEGVGCTESLIREENDLKIERTSTAGEYLFASFNHEGKSCSYSPSFRHIDATDKGFVCGPSCV